MGHYLTTLHWATNFARDTTCKMSHAKLILILWEATISRSNRSCHNLLALKDEAKVHHSQLMPTVHHNGTHRELSNFIWKNSKLFLQCQNLAKHAMHCSAFPPVIVWGSCFWFCIPPLRLLRSSASSPSLSRIFIHTTMPHTIFHTQLSHTKLSHTTLSHTICEFSHTIFVTHHLSHTSLSHTIFHTHLCHRPSFTQVFKTSTFVWRGRSGTWWHRPTFLRGIGSTYGTGQALVARLVPVNRPWRRATLRGRRGTWWHPSSFCVAAMELDDIDLRFAWQAWHLWRHRLFFCVASVALVVTLAHTTLAHTIFVTQLCYTPPFTTHLSHTHTTLSHTHNFVKHHIVTHNFVTHTHMHLSILTHHLCHTPSFRTQLCDTTALSDAIFHTTSFTHNFVTHNFVTHHVSHTTFSHHNFEFVTPQLCPTTTLSHAISHTHLSHTALSHAISHTHLSHTALSQTIFLTPQLSCTIFVTHHLSHTTLSHAALSHTHTHTHANLHIQVFKWSILHYLFCLSFLPHPTSTFVSAYWKKLTCGVIWPFNLHKKQAFWLREASSFGTGTVTVTCVKRPGQEPGWNGHIAKCEAASGRDKKWHAL